MKENFTAAAKAVQIDEENSSASKHIKAYDFSQPKLVSKEIMGAFRTIHELLSRSLTRVFTDSLNQRVDVMIEDIGEVIFSEFLSELEPPVALFLFNIEELGDWAIMEIDPSFCMYSIERQSGSRETSMKPARALTRIEERIISRIIDKVFKELTHVWSPYLNMTILNHVYESKPANIRTISSHVPGIVIRYEVRVEEFRLPFKICYPYALLKEQMNDSFHKPEKPMGRGVLSARQKRSLENDIKSVKAPLQVLLGKTKISMLDLVDLEAGDVIKLDQAIDEPLPVMINGRQKMVGYPGIMSGNKAIKVFEISNFFKNK